MQNIRYIPVLLGLVMLTSCSKMLDKKPQDSLTPDTYYQTEEQLNFALNAVYDALGNSALYGNWMHGRMGLDADEGFYSYSSQNSGPSVCAVSAADPQVANFWRVCYDGINRANQLLAYINRPVMDEGQRNVIRGEALFLRSYFYFMLVTNFRSIPLVLDPTTANTSTQVPQTPMAEVYQRITTDMIEAEGLVRTASQYGFGGRVNKSAVRGMLARVYLHWAGYPLLDVSKYQQARDWALQVINSGEHQLNASYQQIFINYAQDKYDVKESIWEVEFWGNDGTAYREGGRVGSGLGIRQSADDSIGTVSGYMNTTGWLFRLYQATDLRRDWAIGPYRFSGKPAVKTNYTSSQIYNRNAGKWRREYETIYPKSNTVTPQNYPLLRYSDVLLMYAEAENAVNSGPDAAAYLAINQVRRRGYGKPVATPDASVDLPAGLDRNGFLYAIQDERARELCFECLRKGDLVRWGIFLPRMKAIEADFNNGDAPSSLQFGVLGFRNATDKDQIWPIPNYEISLNRRLVQNPGW